MSESETTNQQQEMNDALNIVDACDDVVMDKLGPAALTGGKMSFYDVAHIFFKAGVEWERKGK